MKIFKSVFFLFFMCSALFLSGAEGRKVLLLGHGSDTWKLEKALTDGNIASQTIRTWPSMNVYSAYSAVYIGESVQGIALNAWNDADFNKVKKYVAGGGILILSGDTAFQLTGNNRKLAAKYADFLGFRSFTLFPNDPASFAVVTEKTLAAKSACKGKYVSWLRNATISASDLAEAKIFLTFTVKGKNYAAGTVRTYGKGKVYYLAPTFQRIAGNGEIELGYHAKNGKWELNEQGRGAERFASFLSALFNTFPAVQKIPSKSPAVITGGDASRVSMALRNENIEYKSVKQLLPSEYKKYALVYIGETLKHDKQRKNWLDPETLKTVQEYLENGGVIVTSGNIPSFLAGRDMGVLASLFGFSSFGAVKQSDVKEFLFTKAGENWRKKAAITSRELKWNNRINTKPGKLTTATVLGEFRTNKGNIPAFTVNKVGKGFLYWIATNPYRLIPNKNEVLGEPDEYGLFILNERGRASADLQKLFVTLFRSPANIALRKDFPEKAQWGLVPLGKPGDLPKPANFPKQVVYKKYTVPDNAFLLSKERKAQAVIVSTTKKTLSLAKRVAKYLHDITGAEFRIVHSVPKNGNAVILFDETNAHIASKNLKDAGTDTAIAETKGNKLYLGGKGDGTTLAVYYFLDKLGVRKLWPGKGGTVIPVSPTLYAPRLSLYSTPKLSTRAVRSARIYFPRAAQGAAKCSVDLKTYLGKVDKETAAYFNWYGIVSDREKGVRWARGLSHTKKNNLYMRFKNTHPEYFALQSNGSRSQDASPLRFRLCHSNKNMIRQVAMDSLKALEESPKTNVVSIPLTDGGGPTFCMCIKCRELDPVNAAPENIPFLLGMTRQNVKYVALTDRVLAFSNAVAEIVVKKRPDAKIYMYVYSHYTSAPVKVKPHPSLLILIANVNYTKESMRKNHIEDMKKYAMFPGEYFWRTNALRGFYTELAPQDFSRKIFEDIELFKANVISGTDIDCMEHHWAYKPLVYYSMAKALWNPDRLSFEDIADDFCKRGFGKAAGEMRAYFDLLEKTTDAAAGAEGEYLQFFDEKVIASLQALLKKAEMKAKDSPQDLERIAFVSAGLKGGILSRKLYMAKKKNDSVLFEKLRKEFITYVRTSAETNPFILNPASVGRYDNFVK